MLNCNNLLLAEWKKFMGESPLSESVFKNQYKKAGLEEKKNLNNCELFIKGLCSAASTFKGQAAIDGFSKTLNGLLFNCSIEYPIEKEPDIVAVRNACAEAAVFLGFGSTDKVKLATVVSELARNIVYYAGNGKLSFGVIKTVKTGMKIVSTDSGPGIENVDYVMSDSYVSKRGMGMGLKGVKKLVDGFRIESQPGKGTTVEAIKFLR